MSLLGAYWGTLVGLVSVLAGVGMAVGEGEERHTTVSAESFCRFT